MITYITHYTIHDEGDNTLVLLDLNNSTHDRLVKNMHDIMLVCKLVLFLNIDQLWHACPQQELLSALSKVHQVKG